MKLTSKGITAAKVGPKVRKLSDGGSLQLWIMPTGAKYWRFAYRHAGRQSVLALGSHPAVSLKQARQWASDARALLAQNVDPSAHRRDQKRRIALAAAATFGAVADELIEKRRREGAAAATLQKLEWLLSLATRALESRPISSITAADILPLLKTAEARGRLETGKRLRSAIGQVFRYAISTARADNDPTLALHGAIASPKVKHRAAILNPTGFGSLLRAIDGYTGAAETRMALQLLAFTFVRPGELRTAEWSEFDLTSGVWTIPGHKTKMRREHRVPLAPQAVALLRELQGITGSGRYLFPSIRSPHRCMSEGTLNAALRRLGYKADEATSHGFRSTASTMLNESGQFDPDVIERQLAHQDTNAVRRAYARGDYWLQRVKLMRWWADCLDALRSGDVAPNVVY